MGTATFTVSHLLSRAFFFALDVLLPRSEVLLQEIVAVAAFETLEQVLAVNVLDERSLADVGETLEDSAAVPIVPVDIHDSLLLTFAFNAGDLLYRGLFARDVRRSCCALAFDLVEVTLLLRHIV